MSVDLGLGSSWRVSLCVSGSWVGVLYKVDLSGDCVFLSALHEGVFTAGTI